MDIQKFYFVSSILILLPLFALYFTATKSEKQKKSKIIAGVIIAMLAFFSLTTYFNFWKFHTIYIDNPEVSGKTELHRPFHWHENYHYYIGGKYFSELGYFGTYNCVAAADEERGRMINPNFARNLRNVLVVISREEAMSDCVQNFKNKFTRERWDEFKKDLNFLASIGAPEWWDIAIADAGFNPPPSSVIFYNTAANIIPLESSTYLLLPLLDILLLLCVGFLIARNFGMIPFGAFVVVFGSSHIANYGWNGGSFLRYFWFFNLVVAMSFLQKKRYFKSGIFFGISSMLRIFPIFFALGVLFPLFFNFKKNKKNILNFISGGMLAGATLAILSLLIFGFDAWRDFLQNIMLHKDIHYVFHIGFKKIATFAEWVPNQNFHGEGGLLVFENWNHKLWALWRERLWFYLPLSVFVTGAAVVAARKITATESALLLGTILIFFTNMPANYYFVFLALIPVVLYSRGQTRRKHLISFGLFAFLIFIWMTPFISPDGIVQNFYICCALGVFLIWWILLCLLPFNFLQKKL